MLDEIKIVRNEDVSDARLLLNILQQINDLRLDRDIERRYRLVADQHLRLDRESAGDADALPLSARKLVRIALKIVSRQSDAAQQFGDPRAFFAALAHPVQA